MNKHRYLLHFFLIGMLCATTTLFAQTNLSERGEIFRDDVIARVDIFISTDSLELLLLPENSKSNHHYPATFIFNNGTINDTIENIGFRIRGNTSRHSAKKSFKISFNKFESGRKYHGLKKLNLNGEHNDPAVMRSKICWDLYRDMKLPASRSNYVKLFINDLFYGLYINVEHIDEQYLNLYYGNKNGNLYKCFWPADLTYIGKDPNLYKGISSRDRRIYDLHTNTQKDDYSDLAHFIDVLNNTPFFLLHCPLEEIFNVDNYLKYLAMDIALGNWDGAVFNITNYYLYQNTATGKFEYIPYDLDNTLGIDWFKIDWASRNIYTWSRSFKPFTLHQKIMSIKEYRDRFSFYLAEFQTNYFNEEHLFPRIDELKTQITEPIIADTFRTLDYGFTIGDFLACFDSAIDYDHTPIGIKAFITKRIESNTNQLVLNNIFPIISYVQNNSPRLNQDIHISAQLQDDGLLMDMQVCYSINEESDINCISLFDDGAHQDDLENDGIYGAIIPAIEGALTIHYYVEVMDELGLRSQQPRCVSKLIVLGSSISNLFINEFMASNDHSISDESNEFDDWLELYYNGADSLYLGDKYLSDNINIPSKWKMPDLTISQGEYLLFWADNDEEQGDRHTNFKLSASGEFIGVFDNEENHFALIDGYDFENQQTDISTGRIPDGTGDFQQVNTTPAAMNEVLTAIPFTLEEDSFLVYPNPFSKQFIIECASSKEWIAQLIDPLGRVLLSQKLTQHTNTIDTKDLSLSAGIYFLKVFNKDGKIEMMRLLIRK